MEGHWWSRAFYFRPVCLGLAASSDADVSILGVIPSKSLANTLVSATARAALLKPVPLGPDVGQVPARDAAAALLVVALAPRPPWPVVVASRAAAARMPPQTVARVKGWKPLDQYLGIFTDRGEVGLEQTLMEMLEAGGKRAAGLIVASVAEDSAREEAGADEEKKEPKPN